MSMPCGLCRGQRTTYRSWFSPPCRYKVQWAVRLSSRLFYLLIPISGPFIISITRKSKDISQIIQCKLDLEKSIICVRNLRSCDQGQQTGSHPCLHSPYLVSRRFYVQERCVVVFCFYVIQELCVCREVVVMGGQKNLYSAWPRELSGQLSQLP